MLLFYVSFTIRILRISEYDSRYYLLQKELISKETKLEAIKSLVAEKRKGWPTFKDEINIIS